MSGICIEFIAEVPIATNVGHDFVFPFTRNIGIRKNNLQKIVNQDAYYFYILSNNNP